MVLTFRRMGQFTDYLFDSKDQARKAALILKAILEARSPRLSDICQVMGAVNISRAWRGYRSRPKSRSTPSAELSPFGEYEDRSSRSTLRVHLTSKVRQPPPKLGEEVHSCESPHPDVLQGLQHHRDRSIPWPTIGHHHQPQRPPPIEPADTLNTSLSQRHDTPTFRTIINEGRCHISLGTAQDLPPSLHLN
jgi:hypothetical protein